MATISACSCNGLITVVRVDSHEGVVSGDGFCTADFTYDVYGKCDNGCKEVHLGFALTNYDLHQILAQYPGATRIN